MATGSSLPSGIQDKFSAKYLLYILFVSYLKKNDNITNVGIIFLIIKNVENVLPKSILRHKVSGILLQNLKKNLD